MTKEKRCHPELVSGSHCSIYPLVFVYKIYEMPKQVRHDSLVWVRWGKKVEKYTRCRNKFGMTFKKRGDIPTSTPHPQRKPPQFSPSPDACASPSPLKGEGKKGLRTGEGKEKRSAGKGRGEKRQRRGKGEKKSCGRRGYLREGQNRPPHTHPQQKPPRFSPCLRVPLSPQGRGNFCHTEPTPNCHAELILNCHAELVSASLLQPTENQLRSPTQLCVLINADATHNESPIRGFALISSFLQN